MFPRYYAQIIDWKTIDQVVGRDSMFSIGVWDLSIDRRVTLWKNLEVCVCIAIGLSRERGYTCHAMRMMLKDGGHKKLDPYAAS